MKTYRWIGLDKIQYLLEKIKEKYYTKSEVDAMLGPAGDGHAARAYYYTSEEWARLDPVLQEGEFGIDSTTGFMKIGDGIHKWSEMDYAIFPVSLSQRGDNLLLKENEHDLFLGEQAMRRLILEVIMQYHDDDSTVRDFITADEYYFITADDYQFTHKSQKA